jgi:hypothetical protein
MRPYSVTELCAKTWVENPEKLRIATEIADFFIEIFSLLSKRRRPDMNGPDTALFQACVDHADDRLIPDY